ncbi:hypothetical protein CHS0354_038010 [Potamilus streckersoni]|uniref:Uncharacterized protein n=1 Tax=Potamilus streckersoni TaxID=2493646 RepID=A0AAE0WDA0_9BIVA|nr:hypothetical protein CHS0354_038010 [Potamilus streckersoni]
MEETAMTRLRFLGPDSIRESCYSFCQSASKTHQRTPHPHPAIAKGYFRYKHSERYTQS